MFEVKSFGRDCLGNISGFEVVGCNGKIVRRFVADIYKPNAHQDAKGRAERLAAHLNSGSAA